MKLDEVGRTKLLPRSGVAVIGPWLVIAREGNPVIRVDLRMLDGVRSGTADDDAEADDDDSEDENNRFEWPGQPDPASHVILICDELEVALYLADGPEAVSSIVQQAAPLLRSATNADHNAFVFVNDVAVRRRVEHLQVGPFVYLIREVLEYARVGANIPLEKGGLLQAALAMLVVVASERDLPGSARERQD